MTPREPRRSVLIRARMRIDGVRVDVCILNISSRGLLLQSSAAPSRATYIEIFCGSLTIVGRVVWSKNRRFGIQTQDRLNVDAVVEQSARPPSARDLASVARPSESRSPAPHKVTAVDVAQRYERSRQISMIFEFGCFGSIAHNFASVSLSICRSTSTVLRHVVVATA
jgi:hypothetical protein